MSLSESDPRYTIHKEVKSFCAQKHYIALKKLDYDTNTDLCNPELIDRVGPHTPEGDAKDSAEVINKCKSKKKSQATLKRRNRRNKLKSLRSLIQPVKDNDILNKHLNVASNNKLELNNISQIGNVKDNQIKTSVTKHTKMSDNKSRDSVLAARQAKKLAKQKAKSKDTAEVKDNPTDVNTIDVEEDTKAIKQREELKSQTGSLRSKDEVDKVCAKVDAMTVDEKNKEQIKAERAAKKALKQAKKKGTSENEIKIDNVVAKNSQTDKASNPINEDMTVKDVVETLRDIVDVAKDIKNVTEKVSAINLTNKKSVPDNKVEGRSKSKAELRAERRAKQEAQRAAKQVVQEEKVNPKSNEVLVKITADRGSPNKDMKSTKLKSVEKLKTKSQSSHRVNWFQHLYKDVDNESLRSIPINSHLHPAIIKLGVQLASRVVTGSNARCVALLDALKKMVRDYTLPAKTEFARGLESHLVSSLVYLWASRPPSASQENAVKFFRYHLTQLPNNVDEFDAKKTLQEEIDRYIREQIDMAGEAISITVRSKISNGDNILTYGCSSLIERILREAWAAGVHFRTVVVGGRLGAPHAGAELARRLVARGLPCAYADLAALAAAMATVNKVVLGAGALLGNGSVLGAAGSAQVALAARARNVPVLVACETHKFCERVQTDAFVYNEIGDPDDLIDKSDDNTPLKDWRSNQNLTPLNLRYDVTPASLVTAVVTELAILPCTSAPVVLRFKLSEYGV